MSKATIDMILGIVRHGLTAGGALLITKGVTDQAGADSLVNSLCELIGALITAGGLAWSIWRKYKRTKTEATPAMVHPNVPTNLTGLLLIGALLSSMLVAGCQTPNAAGRALVSTVQTVDAAMSAWADYVALGKATESQQTAVRKAYATYQLAEQAAESAYLAATQSNDMTGYKAAKDALIASQQSLLTLINQFTQTK